MAAMLAQPALAQTLPGIPGGGSITVSTGGSAPAITAPNANTLDVDLNAPRTVINWASLHVSGADSMTFHFDANSDIVLNKTTSQIAIDAGGTISGLVGASAGGNVWFYSPQGVIVSPGAVMTGGGFLFSRGAGIVDAGFVDAADPLANLRAATDALIRITTVSTATSASINSTGDVVLSASSGALNVAIAEGATVDVSTTSGSITAGEVAATSGAASVTAGGSGATVTQITGATGVTVSSNFNTSVGSATTTTSGDIVLGSGGSVSLTLGNSARDTLLTAPLIFLSTLDAGRDAILTGDTGVTVTNRIFAGDDIELTASNGDITAGGAFLRSTGAGASDDAHILLRSDTGAVTATNTLQTQGTGTQAGDITVQAATTASAGAATATRDLKVTGVTASLTSGSAARDVFVTATTGGATVTTAATAGDDVEVTATTGAVSANGATLKSTGVGAADDAHVLARSTGSTVNVGSAITQGTGASAGDVTISAATTASLASGSASRDLAVTGSNAISLTGAYSATGTASFTSATNAVTQASGSITAGTLTVDAALGVVLTQAGNNVTNLGIITGGAGGFAYHDLDDFGLTGAIFSGGDVSLASDGGAITQTAGTITAATLNVSAGTGITLNQANFVTSLGVLNNTTSGAISFHDDVGFDLTDDIDSAGHVSLFADNGDITHVGGTLHAGGDFLLNAAGLITVGDLSAGGDVGVTAAGDVDVNFATAGGGIDLTSNGGHAILRKAVLTGSGTSDNLSIAAAGDAILGADDYLTITPDNVFTRTGGGTGTAGVTSTSGDALIHLDTSAAFDTVEGEGVDVTISTGPASFGAITANTNNIYVEALDGALTVGTATAANGDVELYDAGGDLTLTGSAHGAGLVHLETDGLLDGTLASLISSDGDIELIGGGVDVVHLRADGMIEATAIDANAYVELAEAGQTVVVASFNGDATLRGATGPDGVAVVAFNTATFGADDRASITADNYVDTNPSCGCGLDGLQVTSFDGNVVVNINSASNGIDLVGASIGGDVTVVQTSGDLKINEVAGYNIALEAADGTLETGHVVTSGGDYTISGHDFLGDVLTPDLFNGLIHDVTITDTLGDLDLGTAAIHADHWLAITATDGAVTGAAQLSAGSGLNDGRVVVTGERVALDAITSDGLVTLDGGNGLVDVATSLDVWGNYNLRGGDFANAALRPQGSMLGTWGISDRIGGFDFSGKTLHYGGAVLLFVHGVVNGGDITVDVGNIYAEVDSGHLGTLTAPMFVGATSVEGGIDVDLIRAGTTARVWATDFGTAHLGAAIMTGAGATQVLVKAFDGDAILGAATPGAITAANVVTSTGATATVEVTGATGRVDVNLDHVTGTNLTTIDAAQGAAVKVANGPLTIDQLMAGTGAQVTGGGETRLVWADVDGDLTVASTTGGLRFGDVTSNWINVRGDLTLNAATDITQQGAFDANALNVTAGTGVVLLGDNRIAYLGAVNVAAGGFAFHDTTAFDVYGPVNAVGQTVDLRSDDTIGQVSTGIITAKTLKGSSVGGANFGTFNQVAELGDFSNAGGGLLKLVAGRSLTVTGTVRSAGTVSLTSHGGMTFAGAGTVRGDGAGDAVTLVSDGVFTNARGADAVTAANGRWLIYTQAVGNAQGSTAGNTFNGLAGKSFYGAAYDFFNERFNVSINGGNRFVYGYQPTLTVTPAGLVMTYDGTVPTLSATITGLVDGDLAANAWSGAPTISGANGKNVGTYALAAGAGGLTSDLNYAFAFGTGTLRIDPRTLTVTADGAIKAFGQVDPTLSYRVTAGSLAAGDAFTGGLGREVGEVPGGYAITRGTLALSANYDVTFTGAVLTIRPLPSNQTGGSPVLQHLNRSPDFTLDWDPETDLTTEGQAPSQASAMGGGKVVAALR